MVMRIGIDCRFITEKPHGIGNYTIALIRDLLQIDTKNQYVLLTNNPANPQIQPLQNSRTEVHRIPFPPMGIKQKLYAKKFINPLNLDVYHYPHHDLPFGINTKTVITIHHLVPLAFSTGPPLYQRILLLTGMLWSIKRADAVIAVSKFTQKSVQRILGNGQPVEPIYLPFYLYSAEKENGTLLPDQLRPQKYFLSVAEWRPHKNLHNLIRAFNQILPLLPEEWKLVLAGSQYKNYDLPRKTVAELKIDDRVWLAGKVSDDLLAMLYKNARAMIMVSRWEGFGYPIVEAMYHGTPIICSNAAAMPEIAGDAALLVNPEKIDQIASVMLQVATDDKLVLNLKKKGESRLPKFISLAPAQKTLELYQKLALK